MILIFESNQDMLKSIMIFNHHYLNDPFLSLRVVLLQHNNVFFNTLYDTNRILGDQNPI